ncbi:MAG: S8 family serine peptidase [Bacteroidota bacterium]|nr:S8 family serine peptidase [Bacteroidota bacterium]
MTRNILLRSIVLGLILLITLNVSAQNKYWVFLSDKNNVEFNPYEYFDQKAIERRIDQGLPIYDITDMPLNKGYVTQIEEIANDVNFQSRWFNALSIVISTEEQKNEILKLPFVKKITKSETYSLIFATYSNEIDDEVDKDKEMMHMKQTERMGGKLFEKNNIRGKGIRIAVFDGGFPQVDEHPAFEHLRENKQIIKTYDFTKKEENVYHGHKHGRMTLACIGGIYKGVKIGLATEAEYLLARTEINTEPFSEEENWLAAAEWADKNGANIISSSLGYGKNRYFTSNMNGKNSLVVKAANMAARKGILVVNSAGNEATKSWKAIITPADGDSVLTVGGIDPKTDYHISFSSYGPTADKRLKPNVSAYGHVVTAGKEELTTVDGTSFSCPLTAGFAACAWQTKKDFSNMELFKEIEKSGHLFPYFDYAHGYGIPQAKHFVSKIDNPPKQTFEFKKDEESLKVIVLPNVVNQTEWLVANTLLFYQIIDTEGMIKKYFVVKVEQNEALELKLKDFSPNEKIKVHFRGYTKSITF